VKTKRKGRGGVRQRSRLQGNPEVTPEEAPRKPHHPEDPGATRRHQKKKIRLAALPDDALLDAATHAGSPRTLLPDVAAGRGNPGRNPIVDITCRILLTRASPLRLGRHICPPPVTCVTYGGEYDNATPPLQGMTGPKDAARAGSAPRRTREESGPTSPLRETLARTRLDGGGKHTP
jgi:hypothetical protein